MPRTAAVDQATRIAFGAGAAFAAAIFSFFAFGLLPLGSLLGLVGVGLAAAGTVGVVLHKRWGVVVLGVGVGLVAGTTAYVVIGILQPDGPACGGVGCA